MLEAFCNLVMVNALVREQKAAGRRDSGFCGP